MDLEHVISGLEWGADMVGSGVTGCSSSVDGDFVDELFIEPDAALVYEVIIGTQSSKRGPLSSFYRTHLGTPISPYVSSCG